MNSSVNGAALRVKDAVRMLNTVDPDQTAPTLVLNPQFSYGKYEAKRIFGVCCGDSICTDSVQTKI